MRKYFLIMLVAAAVTAIPASGGIIPPTTASVTCPAGLRAGGPTGTFTATLTGPAPPGLTATPDSSNPAVATVPGPFTIPAGAITFTFQVTPVGAGNADIGVRVSTSRLDCGITVAAVAAAPAGGPTLSTTGLLIMAALIAITGALVIRRL